jgi:hypothetical protein
VIRGLTVRERGRPGTQGKEQGDSLGIVAAKGRKREVMAAKQRKQAYTTQRNNLP